VTFNFLLRDAMHRADARRLLGCPSARPSQAGILSKRRLHIGPIFKLFPPSSSHTILVFSHQTVWQHSSNAKGMKKITIFDKYLALSQKWYKIEL